MDILLIGSGYFKPWLTRAGVGVRHLGPDPECEIKADPDRIDLGALISSLDNPPDVVLLTDDLGRRVLPPGLERVGQPKVYYGVDSPINFYWQRHLAGLFDLVCLDQRDQARNLSEELDREVLWLPVGVDPSLYMGPPEEEEHDFAFVGTREESVRPKRSAILDLLGRNYSLKTVGDRAGGWVGPREAARLYRRSRLVLNENLFPGLTTRMLEVMASGACLFSEDVDNGVWDLFRDGVHYIAFNESNIVSRADTYLRDRAARQALGQKGQELCREKHSIQARAQELLGLIQGLRPRAQQPDFSSLGWAFLLLGLRWPGPEAKARIARAGLLFREGLRRNRADAKACLGLALALVAQAKQAQALEVLQARDKGLAEDFRFPLIQAFLLHESGRTALAINSFRYAAEALGAGLEKGLEPGRSATGPGDYGFHLFWGLALDRAGDGLCPGFDRYRLPLVFWGGAEHLRRALELAPSRPEAFQALARIMDREGQFAFSHPLWQMAAKLAPEDQEALAQERRAASRAYQRV